MQELSSLHHEWIVVFNSFGIQNVISIVVVFFMTILVSRNMSSDVLQDLHSKHHSYIETALTQLSFSCKVDGRQTPVHWQSQLGPSQIL